MLLKFSAEDWLTGARLPAGTEAVACRLGGKWFATAEPVEPVEWRKLVESVALSCSPDAGGPADDLDHEDYRLLEHYGRQYPRVAARIGCAVPGLDDA